MNREEIEEIRALHTHCGTDPECHVPALLTEIDRLQHLASQRQEQAGGATVVKDEVGWSVALIGTHVFWSSDQEEADWLSGRINDALRAQAAAQGAQDEIHWKTRRSLLKERDEAHALVARLGEYAKHRDGCVWYKSGLLEREGRSQDECTCGLAEIAPTTPTP